MMLKLLRFPLGTPLFVRPLAVVAISQFSAETEGHAAVVHISADAREAVWGTAVDINRTLGMESLHHMQVVYDGLVKHAFADAAARQTKPCPTEFVNLPAGVVPPPGRIDIPTHGMGAVEE